MMESNVTSRLLCLQDTAFVTALGGHLNAREHGMTPDPNIFFGPQRPQSLNSVPPDSHMAVGPSNVVVTVNDAIAWYDKNGKEQQLQSLEAFFGLGVSSGLFDSRVVYDALGGHFYVISPYRNQNAFDPTKGESRIYVAESNTSDPTQGWHSFVFNSLLTSTSGATTTNYWVDYPTLAVDAYAVYITANYIPFSAADTEPGDDLEDEPPPDVAGGSSTRLFMLDKNISAQQIYDPEKMFGINLQTPHAATVYGSQAALTGSFLVAYEQNNNASSLLHVFKVNNAAMGSSGGASFSMTTIDVGNISNTKLTVVKQPNPIGLDAGNDWIYSAVWRGGILYATTEIVPVNTPDRAVVHWFRVNTTNMTLMDQGDVTADSLGPGISTSYGSIAVNANGQFAIGFSASSSGLYAGAYDAVYGPDGMGRCKPSKRCRPVKVRSSSTTIVDRID
jgi:hypothetical protein